MIDAVDSGGFGVLGLYAARVPAVPEPPASPPVTESAADAGRAAPAATGIQGQGNAPLAPAEPGADGSAGRGRDFGDSSHGQARQTAVLTALAAMPDASRLAGTGASLASSASAPPTARALRAYDRAGSSVSSGGASGRMLVRRA